MFDMPLKTRGQYCYFTTEFPVMDTIGIQYLKFSAYLVWHLDLIMERELRTT